jgi:hypothetical protein
MLAYVFWHRPAAGADPGAYEDAQRAFHLALGRDSACFRLARLPFAADPGYEDWYLVEDWADLGRLNEEAVDPARRPSHDRAAGTAAAGWGAVYGLVKGPPVVPDAASWVDRPRGQSREALLASLPETTVWQRQLVLGPAPELCLADGAPAGRQRIWPG